MSQLRRHSAAEAAASTATGFAISYAVGLWVYPAFGWHISHQENFWIVLIFTGVSLVRQYLWRRVFNWLQWRCW